jgi:acid phosphatase family membrane protein YuiD
MAFTHIVMFRWRDEKFDDTAIAGALSALASGMDEVIDYRCGHDAGLTPGNADFAIIGLFKDRDAFTVYRNHPEHLRILNDMIAPNVEARSAVQWQD